MIAFDGSGLCGRAEAYYHDYLEDESSAAVPREVTDHIRACRHCQQRVESLREILGAAAGDGQACASARDWRLVGVLQRHFAFLGERVSCASVKPFLPGLLEPSLPIRIPTPITVHVDQCPACARDLESLRELELDAEQRTSLSRFYAEACVGAAAGCVRLGSKVSVLVSGALAGVDTEFLNHLYSCSSCRSRLDNRRRAFFDQGLCDGVGGGPLCCAGISAADIFDLAVPRSDPAGENGREQACREHVASCSACRERVEEVHRTVHEIAERADSGVITVCTATKDKQAPGERIEEELYQDYPIDVQVLGRGAEEAGHGRAAASSGRGSSRTFRPFVKMAILAAAMIPLAIVFTLSNPSASGLAVDLLGDAMAEVEYGEVSTFYLDGEREIRREDWLIGRQGPIILEQQAQADTVLDPGEAEAIIGRYLSGSVYESPQGAVVTDASAEPVKRAGGLDVYRLVFRFPGGDEHEWLFHVDPVTKLLHRKEFRQRRGSKAKLQLYRIDTYAYPDDEAAFQQRLERVVSVN